MKTLLAKNPTFKSKKPEYFLKQGITLMPYNSTCRPHPFRTINAETKYEAAVAAT